MLLFISTRADLLVNLLSFVLFLLLFFFLFTSFLCQKTNWTFNFFFFIQFSFGLLRSTWIRSNQWRRHWEGLAKNLWRSGGLSDGAWLAVRLLKLVRLLGMRTSMMAKQCGSGELQQIWLYLGCAVVGKFEAGLLRGYWPKTVASARLELGVSSGWVRVHLVVLKDW